MMAEKTNLMNCLKAVCAAMEWVLWNIYRNSKVEVFSWK